MTVRLLGPAEVRDLAGLLGLTPTKKLGQNFVIDANTVRRIVRTAEVGPGDHVLEIGPGLGSLTLGLLEAGARVTAVEIDARLADQLPRTVAEAAGPAAAALTVRHADALTLTAADLAGADPAADAAPGVVPAPDAIPAPTGTAPGPTRLVANLPYNVSVPVLLHLLPLTDRLAAGVVMVQAEVGHRLAASPGSKVYGSPSVKAAWYGAWRTAGTVSRQVFWPVPNVDSILVAFERRHEPGDEALRRRVFAVVDAAFQQRRKMLRQSLSGLFGGSGPAAAALEAAGAAPTARGEELDVAAFVRIARQLGDSGQVAQPAQPMRHPDGGDA